MAISMQDYVVRLRAIYQQVEALSNPDGSLPILSDLRWTSTHMIGYTF